MEFKELLSTKEIDRDEKWEDQFLTAFTKESFDLIYPDAKPGPDNWPYLWLKSETENKTAESSQKILHWLKERGIGIVLNPHKEYPDYVFTYGMIWFYNEWDTFKVPEETPLKNEVMDFQMDKLSYGYPSKEYIPTYVRKILKDFFLQQGLYNVRWILLTEDKENYDLCFSLESLKNPDKKEHQGLLEAISWFLPNHYRLGLMSEKNLAPFQAID